MRRSTVTALLLFVSFSFGSALARPKTAQPLEANDPALTAKVHDRDVMPPWIRPAHVPSFGNGPTPFPAPVRPPKPTPISVTLDGTPGDIDTHVGDAAPSDQVPVTFHAALVDVYLRGMTRAIRRADGSLKLIVGCPEPLTGRDRRLADHLMRLPLPNAFSGAIMGFQRWYGEAGAVELPGVWLGEWTREELQAAWVSYAAAWLGEHEAQVEPLRAAVADAVIAAGLRRADDLLVTPAAAEAAPRVADCITCTPPLVCSCQTYDAATADCAGAATSCTVIEFGSKAKTIRQPW